MDSFSINLKQWPALASSDIPICSFDLVKSVDTEICFTSGKNRDFLLLCFSGGIHKECCEPS